MNIHQATHDTQVNGNNTQSSMIDKLLNDWNGIDDKVGLELWQQLRTLMESSGDAVLALISMAKNDPQKFRKLLQINNSTFVLSEKASYAECMVAVLLTVYEWSEHFLYRIMLQVMEKPSSLSKNPKGSKLFCHLSWVFHCLTVFFPGLFPNIRKGFQLKQANNHEPTNILDLMPTTPGRLMQCMNMLPFQSPRTFLTCFGANKIGRFHVGHSVTGLTESCFPPVHKIFKSLQLCETTLSIRYRASSAPHEGYSINDEDASFIAQAVFGIHPSYWAFQSAKMCGLQGYAKLQGIISKTWDSALPKGWDAANNAARKKYNEMKRTKKHLLLKQKATEEKPVDTQTDSFLDKEPSFMERSSAKTKWLAKIQLREQPEKKRIKLHPAFQFKPSLQLDVLREAADIWKKRWSRTGLPLDSVLLSGIAIRKAFGAPDMEEAATDKLQIDLHKLGKGGSPSVMLFKNAFSKWFLDKDREVTNTTLFCKDTNSDGGSSSIAAFFHCDHCSKAPDTVSKHAPLMRVGEHNSVMGILSSAWEKMKMEMATEIANQIIQEANQKLTEKRQEWKSVASKHCLTEGCIPPSDTVDEAQLLEPNLLHSYVETDFRLFPEQRINCNICKVGTKAKYGQHQDSSWILNSTATEEKNA